MWSHIANEEVAGAKYVITFFQLTVGWICDVGGGKREHAIL